VRPVIRDAGQVDLEGIVSMAETALASVHPDLPFDADITAEVIEQSIDDPSMLVCVAEDDIGLCGLLIARAEYSWFGPGSVASDWVTYAAPRARGWLWYRLIKAYTEWAIAMGATVINTANLSSKSDDGVVYAITRLGYDKAGSMVRRKGVPCKGAR